MVYNGSDLVTDFIHNSVKKNPTKTFVAPGFLMTTSLIKTRISPLMARPFDDFNVTAGNTGGSDGDKPPETQNG